MKKVSTRKAPRRARGDVVEGGGSQDAPLRKPKIVGRGLRANRRIPLRGLREAMGKTQIEIAEDAEMQQGDLSRLEQRADFKLSTLRRYVKALGGEVQVVVLLPTGHRVVLDV